MTNVTREGDFVSDCRQLVVGIQTHGPLSVQPLELAGFADRFEHQNVAPSKSAENSVRA